MITFQISCIYLLLVVPSRFKGPKNLPLGMLRTVRRGTDSHCRFEPYHADPACVASELWQNVHDALLARGSSPFSALPGFRAGPWGSHRYLQHGQRLIQFTIVSCPILMLRMRIRELGHLPTKGHSLAQKLHSFFLIP